MIGYLRKRFDTNYLFACMIVASTFLLSNCQQKHEGKQGSKQLNIILMFTDELQFSDIGAFGGNFPTPEIDRLAREGLKFAKAYTPASMCTPSRFAALTGLYPGRCTAPTFLSQNPEDQPYNIAWNTWITPDLETLPEILGRNGYTTGMSGKWHVGHLPDSTKIPELHLEDDPDDPEVENKLKIRQNIYKNQVKAGAGFDIAESVVWANFDNEPVEELRFHNFPWITRGAIRFLAQQKDSEKPFFLYVTPTAIHGPNHVKDLEKDKTYTPEGRQIDVLKYNLDEEKLKSEIKDLQAGKPHRYAGIANIDFQLGLIRKKLEEIGKDKNTVIIFISDHNIEPGKATSYEKGTNVPMIVYWPGITTGQESSSLVSSLDIYPTILDLAGIQKTDGLQLDGQSFLPVIHDPTTQNREYVFSENGYTRSVTDGRFKYIALRYPERLIEAMKRGEIDYAPSYVGNWPQAHSAIAMKCFPAYFEQNQFYDLLNDPYEIQNIYNEQDENVQYLKEVLEDHLATFTHPFDLNDILYLETDDFKRHSQVNLNYNLANIPWVRSDHGGFVWPPKE